MTFKAFLLSALAGATITSPASARDFCPERPGQTTPPCTVEPGHVVVETALADWTLEKTPDARTDTVTLGQTAARIGIADHAEVALAWTPYAHQRVRDVATGMIDTQSGVGDVTLAVKRSFGYADQPVVAIKALVTIPVGHDPAGQGDWSAALLLPVQLSLSDALQFSLTPEVDAAVNSAGSGHHVAYGSAAGLALKLSKAATLNADLRLIRDDDPDNPATTAAAGTSVAYQASDSVQFDAGGVVGLNKDTPDVELFVGIAKRF